MRTKAKVLTGLLALSWMLPGAPSLARAAALDMTLCVFDQPFSPMTFPDGCGQSLELLRRASALQPVAIRQLVAPRSQCVNRAFYQRYQAQIEAYWQAIALARHTSAFRRFIDEFPKHR